MMTVEQLRVKTIAELGLTSWFGTAIQYRDLSPADQGRVTDSMTAYVAMHPLEFSAGTVAAATRWQTSGVVGMPYQDTSFSASASEFTTELGKQAGSLESNLNPFSERNRGFVLVAAVLLALVYFLPQVKALLARKA